VDWDGADHPTQDFNRIQELLQRLFDEVGKEVLSFETHFGGGAIYEAVCSYLSPDGLAQLDLLQLQSELFELEVMLCLDFGTDYSISYEHNAGVGIPSAKKNDVLIRHMVEYQYELFRREFWSDLPIQMFEEVIKYNLWNSWNRWFRHWSTELDDDSGDWLELYDDVGGLLNGIVRKSDDRGLGESITGTFEWIHDFTQAPQRWYEKYWREQGSALVVNNKDYTRTPYSPAPNFPDSFQKKCIDWVDMVEWMVRHSFVLKGVNIATEPSGGKDWKSEQVFVNNLPYDALTGKLIGFVSWRDTGKRQGHKGEATISIVFVGSNAHFTVSWKLLFRDLTGGECIPWGKFASPMADTLYSQMSLSLGVNETLIRINAWEDDIFCFQPSDSGVGKTLNYSTNAF